MRMIPGAHGCASLHIPVWTYGLSTGRHPCGRGDIVACGHQPFTLRTPAGTYARFRGRLVGEHNVSNLFAAIGVVLPRRINTGASPLPRWALCPMYQGHSNGLTQDRTSRWWWTMRIPKMPWSDY